MKRKTVPDNRDKFWTVGKYQADNKVLTLKQMSCAGRHTFRQIGFNAECTKCPVGYPLGIGGEVREGHIYIKGELVI